MTTVPRYANGAVMADDDFVCRIGKADVYADVTREAIVVVFAGDTSLNVDLRTVENHESFAVLNLLLPLGKCTLDEQIVDRYLADERDAIWAMWAMLGGERRSFDNE
jgi:hypothetical protein